MKNRIIAFTIVGTIALYAFAASRKVSIIADSAGTISLTNSSSSAVTFNASCFDSNGNASGSDTGISLGSKLTMDLGNIKCSGSAYFSNIYMIDTGKTAGYCYKYAAGDPDQSVCPTGSTVCSSAQLIAKGVTGSVAYIVNDYTSATAQYVSYDGGSTWSYSGGSNRQGWVFDSNNKCADDAVGTNTVNNCGATNNVACCKSSGSFIVGVKSCDIEITSTSGHLQSPQFKGSAPF